MDSNRTKINFLNNSIFNLTTRLIFTSVFYFLIIKKIILYFCDTFIYPCLILLNTEYLVLRFEILGDDIIIDSSYENIQRASINLPFSLYYFFFIALIYPKIFRTDVRYIHYYNLVLFIIQPLLIFLVINGFSWSDNLIRVHEIGYKISFLTIGMYIFSNEHKKINAN